MQSDSPNVCPSGASDAQDKDTVLGAAETSEPQQCQRCEYLTHVATTLTHEKEQLLAELARLRAENLWHVEQNAKLAL